MPRGDKSKYTDKQVRTAEHIAEGYTKRGASKKKAARIAWATVNKQDGGGKKSGSGRGRTRDPSPSVEGGRLGGDAPKPRAKRAVAKTTAKKTATAKRGTAKKTAAARRAPAKRTAAAKRTVAKRAVAAKRTVAKKTATAKRAVAKKTASAKRGPATTGARRGARPRTPTR